MEKFVVNLTESEFRRIIAEVVREEMARPQKERLDEMAVERKSYVQYGIQQSATVLRHIGLICTYENDVRMSHWVDHWEDEIAAQVYDLGRIDVTKDNKACKIKKKAFVESFIEARLGKDFSEYDDKMYSYIEDGLRDEHLGAKQIREIDTKGIAARNKERIRKYLFSFVELMSIKDLTELHDMCKEFAHNF